MDAHAASTRNRCIFERRMAGETLASLSAAYSLSLGRIRQIARTEQRVVKREEELREADRLPQQPNILHLSPRLRRVLQRHFMRENVSPIDVLDVGFGERSIYKIANFQRKYWRELVQWMGQAGFPPDP